ncbi:MAG: MATE family efflux transporter [Thermoanaerobacteraceae bacterium]
METKDKGKLNVTKEIIELAWPSITEQMLIMAVGMVSTIFVGHISASALAAVGLINMLIFFLQAMFSGLAIGSTVIVARLIGEEDEKNAKLAVMQSLLMSFGLFLIVTLLGYTFASPIIRTFFGSISPEVFKLALTYYKIVLFGLPFVIIDIVIGGALRGAGDTKTPMYITAVVNIINLFLNSILVFGIPYHGGYIIPPFGVKGSALSATIARVIGGFLQLYVLFFAKRRINLNIKDKIKLDFDMMARIIKVGIPASLEQIIMQGGFLMVQVIVSTMGTTAIAVYQIGMNANSIAFMPMFGFSIAATSLVGRSLGAKHFMLAEIYAKVSRNMAVIVISIVGVFMFIFSKQLASLYTNDPEVIKMASNVLKIFAIVEPFLAILNVMAGVLRAAGDIPYIVLTAFVGLWLFRITIGYILGKVFLMAIYGIWIGISIDFIVRAAMYSYRFKNGKWKYIKV